METLGIVIGLVLMLAIGIGVGWLLRRKPVSAATTDRRSEISELRAIGELSVFRVVTKDILTHTDHSFGDFGKRYLKWAFSQKN